MYNNPLTFKISSHNIQEGSRRHSQQILTENTIEPRIANSSDTTKEAEESVSDVSVQHRKSDEDDVSVEDAEESETVVSVQHRKSDEADVSVKEAVVGGGERVVLSITVDTTEEAVLTTEESAEWLTNELPASLVTWSALRMS